MKKHLLSFFIVNILFIATMQAQKTYTLAFKPANGDKYNVETSIKSKISQNVMGQDMEINMNNDIDMTYDIADDGDNKKLQMTYDRLKVTVDMMGQSQVMDSENPDASDEGSKALKAVKGQIVTVTLSPSGEVVKVEGANEVIDKAAGDEMQKQTLKGILGEDAMKTMMEQSFNFYSKNPVKVGDSWNSTTTLKSPYSITADNTYTLTRVEGGKAFINTVSKLKTEEGAKMEYSGMELAIDLNGDITGTTEVDIETGMPLSSNSKQNLKGNIVAQGMTIPMSVNSDIMMNVSKK